MKADLFAALFARTTALEHALGLRRVRGEPDDMLARMREADVLARTHAAAIAKPARDGGPYCKFCEQPTAIQHAHELVLGVLSCDVEQLARARERREIAGEEQPKLPAPTSLQNTTDRLGGW